MPAVQPQAAVTAVPTVPAVQAAVTALPPVPAVTSLPPVQAVEASPVAAAAAPPSEDTGRGGLLEAIRAAGGAKGAGLKSHNVLIKTFY